MYEAITIAEKNAYDYSLREKVADAVIAQRPEWIIRISIQQAEKLIEPTQSNTIPMPRAGWPGQTSLSPGRAQSGMASLFHTTQKHLCASPIPAKGIVEVIGLSFYMFGYNVTKMVAARCISGIWV